ncbi:type VI secretion system tube protein Hcp [Eleftheria terrae]|uniref:type VI secretion system tube protein Hcp n=1 Tax=Eleftheria terrae TaxID=1597781 RepID=UPI00263AE4D8|nr:type VI secretion system tube protein Hcp [Eleftheria terrae]WKB55665.1 type VI secretion system tube protein Hcp [Eleftheria terrae]
MSLPIAFLDLACLGRPISGESRVQGYENQIMLLTLSWSATAEHSASKVKRQRTELRPGHVVMSKHLDRSSMALYRCANEARRYDRARITVIDPALAGTGDRPVPMLELDLQDGTVVQLATRTSDSAHAKPIVEDISLSFKDMQIRYFPLDPQRLRRPAPTTVLLRSSRYD